MARFGRSFPSRPRRTFDPAIAPAAVAATAGTAVTPVIPTTAAAAVTVPAQPKPNYSSVYMIRIVDMFGTAYAELVNAVVTNITWQLNNWGSCTFTVPTSDPQLGTMTAGPAKIIEREVQVWRDPLDGTPPKLLFWGPIVRARATSQTVEFQANGLLWYYSRRYFGPILHNQISNGDFESGLTGWTATGATASIDTNIVLAGSKALKLVSAAQETDHYASQGFVWSAGAQADEIWVSAHAQIITTEGTAYIGPAFMERGLYVEVINNAGNTLIQAVWQPIDNSAPRNEWFRINAPIVTVPANTTCTVNVRLYSVGGQINWDQVVARFAESQGADTPSTYNDVASIIGNVNAYAQSTTENKSHLNIGGPNRGPLGVVISRQYQFYLQGNIWDTCLSQLVTEGQCEIDVEWDATGTTRTLQCYLKKGSTKPQLALVMGANVGDFSVDLDGQATASSIRVVGQGISAEKTLSPPIPIPAVGDFVGYAVDTSANGGIVLESLESAPPDTSIDGVTSLAANDLTRLKSAVTVATLTAKENLAGALIGQLATGDVIPVSIDYGWVQLSGNMRVAAMALNPVDETLAVTLNADRPAGRPSQAPHILTAISQAEAKILDIQRGVPEPPAAANAEIIYSAPGAVTVSQSPAITPKESLTIIGFSATLATAGSSTTTVVLKVNGTTVATVNLAASATYSRVPVANVPVTGRLGIYAVGITAAGTGAQDLGGEIEVVTSSAAGLF